MNLIESPANPPQSSDSQVRVDAPGCVEGRTNLQQKHTVNPTNQSLAVVLEIFWAGAGQRSHR